MMIWLLVPFSYFFGSIPVGYLLVRGVKKVDVRKFGSGNIGSTNVTRVLGWRWGLVTQVGDILKSLMPTLIASLITLPNSQIQPLLVSATALAAVLGHDFSLFLKFKGGRGVNTSLGAWIVMFPYFVFGFIVIYFIVKKVTHFASLASLSATLVFTLSVVVCNVIDVLTLAVLVSGVLIFVRHHQNIRRLIAGHELKST